VRLLLASLLYLGIYDLSRRFLVSRLRARRLGIVGFSVGWGAVVAAFPWWLIVIGGAALDSGIATLSSAILFGGVAITARLLAARLNEDRTRRDN
jgi:apolipoprotein N-acyltransferase